ncbi:MAG: PE-PGRS family protein [Myxococcota bacterium]|nr:PE-PGRS family protein [Myxococcota bacterium]
MNTRILLVILFLTFELLLAQTTQAQECPQFQGPISLGQANIPGLSEASGLAASRQQAGILWTHNDSGHAPTAFAFESGGALRAAYALSGISNQDWEDMSLGPGPLAGQDYLYLADIGDNAEARNTIRVYRVAEPNVPASASASPIQLNGSVSLEFQYPDGAHDAETLMVDPANADLYILTKDRSGGVSGLYRAAYPQSESGVSTLESLGDVSFPGNVLERPATGGDISPAGDAILVRTYVSAHFWPRTPGESIATTLQGPRCTTTLTLEPQGEAITFTPDGQNFITLSEGTNQPIYEYRRIPTTSLFGPPGIALLAGLLALGGAHRAR